MKKTIHKSTNHTKKYIFQIGFNRCATQSLTEAFYLQGIRSIHYGWKQHHDDYVNYLAIVMQRNLANHNKILHGNLSKYQAFLDMEYAYDNQILSFYTFFKEIYQQYPQSIFIMNTRPIYDWILSRIKIGKTPRAQRYFKEINEEKLKEWVHHYFDHSLAVRDFFVKNPKNKSHFFVFSLTESSIPDLLQQIQQIVPPKNKSKPIPNDLKIDFIQNVHLTNQNKKLPTSIMNLIQELTSKHGDPSQLSWWI
jgi:hypothetical protein